MSDGHATEPKNEPTEPKAKQILSEFAGRLTLVERMTARLRPCDRVCTSRRLFDYFELPDPYHPIDFNKPYKPVFDRRSDSRRKSQTRCTACEGARVETQDRI